MVWTLLGVALLATAAVALKPRPRSSWLAVANGTVSAAAGLLLLLAHGPWQLVPGWIWGGLAAGSVVLAARAISRHRSSAPTAAHGDDGPARRRRTRVGAWLSFGSGLLMFALAVWTL